MADGRTTMTGKALCLNMIVKNEMANLERCLSAVAPHIAGWVIGDTGSTDGTQDFIRSFFEARSIPGELHSFPFENFAQARNEAFDRARASKLRFDYLLLADADMELTVQNPAFSKKLTSAAYKVLQNSGVTYWNNRLLRRDVYASYKGVTHEYLDVRSGQRVGEVAKLMAESGLIVLCSFISPYRAERDMIRRLVADGEFIEVFVDTPIEDCIQRDPKGLYAKAIAGKLKNFTGVDAPYEAPENPEIHLQTLGQSIDELAGIVLRILSEREIIDAFAS